MKELVVRGRKYKLPLYLPDATLGVVRGLDSRVLEEVGVEGVVVNSYHLNDTPGLDVLKKFTEVNQSRLMIDDLGAKSENQKRKSKETALFDKDYGCTEPSGIKAFMNFAGLVVSDSGGWQIFSLIKRNQKKNIGGKITDQGVQFASGGENNRQLGVFTPEDSIRIQFELGADILICLDDFTGADDNQVRIQESVERTILWAQRSRREFDRIVRAKGLNDKNRPLLFAVIQGGWSKAMRRYCATELLKIGFDGYGYGGYMVNDAGELDEEMSRFIANLIPAEYPKFALGVGKPWDIARCRKFGWDIFDCVLPTRDGRHQRLYKLKREILFAKNDAVSTAASIRSSDNDAWQSPQSYEYLYIKRGRYATAVEPIDKDCQCFTCQNYSRGYLHHLFKINDILAYRLAVIHNLFVYHEVITELRKRN